MKKRSFSGGYGMITDYFAAILHSIRNEDRSGEMLSLVKFSGTLSERDHLAIRKTFSGMMKLLYPDGDYTQEEALEIVDFAAEGRKRVKEQLYKIDETFKAEPAVFEYEIMLNGEKRQIKTLEELGRTEVLVEDGNVVAEITPATVGKSANDATAEPKEGAAVNKPVVELGPKHVHVVANQRGISFRSLFGDYLKGARKIVVVDPFLMKPYQIDNLIDLMQLVLDMNAASEEDLRIELHTRIDEMKPQEQNAALEALREELATEGVEFEFTFDASHDRGIFVDDKWAISLGRGLDIYDWFDRHSLKRSSQRMRKCKDFQVTIAQIQQKGATNAS